MPYYGFLELASAFTYPKEFFIRGLPTYVPTRMDQLARPGSADQIFHQKRITVPNNQETYKRWDKVQLYTTFTENDEEKLKPEEVRRCFKDSMDPIQDPEDQNTWWLRYHLVDTKKTAVLWQVKFSQKLMIMALPDAFKKMRSCYRLVKTNLLEKRSANSQDSDDHDEEVATTDVPTTEDTPVEVHRSSDTTDIQQHEDADALGAAALNFEYPPGTAEPEQPSDGPAE